MAKYIKYIFHTLASYVRPWPHDPLQYRDPWHFFMFWIKVLFNGHMFSALVTHLTNSRSSQRGRKKDFAGFSLQHSNWRNSCLCNFPPHRMVSAVTNGNELFFIFYLFIFMHTFYIKNFLRLASNMVWINLKHWGMCYMCMVMLWHFLIVCLHVRLCEHVCRLLLWGVTSLLARVH